MNTDERMLEYLQGRHGTDILEKAIPQRSSNLVQRDVTVNRKDGTTYQSTRMVKPDGDDEKQEKKKVELEDTSEKHKTESGKYTAERGALHVKIRDEIVNSCAKPAAGERPQAILMGGGSAAGKSTMKKGVIDSQLQKQGIKAGTVDADEIKKKLPEYKEYNDADQNQAAFKLHNESSDVGAFALNTAIDEGRHVIYDGTMKSGDKYEKLIEKLEKAGYDVHVYVVDIPLEEAKKRSQARFESSGRKVPEHIIESSHKGVPKTVERLKDKVSSYQVFDNTGKDLKLIAANDYVDPEMYTAFLKKGNVNYQIKD